MSSIARNHNQPSAVPHIRIPPRLILGTLILSCLMLGCQPKSALENAGGDAGSSSNSSSNSSAGNSEPEGPLRLLVLDDPELAAILEREWRARSDSSIELIADTVANFSQQLSPTSKLEADVVIFPPSLMGELAEKKLIRQLPEETLVNAPGYNLGEVFLQVRRREMLWDGRPYAVPFGSPPLTLLYRKDLVPVPPASWDELTAELNRLKGELPENVVPLLQPLAEGWASRVLLSRAAPYLYSVGKVSTVFDYINVQPRIDTPPVIRALEELVVDQALAANSTSGEMTPRQVLESFLAGNAAMAITWPSAIPDTGNTTPVDFEIGIVELPGATERYEFRKKAWIPSATGDPIRVSLTGTSGRLAAISRYAKNVSQAIRFLGWATGPEQSGRMSSRSLVTTLFREAHGSAASAWIRPPLPAALATSYSTITMASLERAEAMHFPRIPGAYRYAELLDAAVVDAIGGADAKQCLTKAAADWTKLTNELGKDAQVKAYQRSLGLKLE